MFLKNHTEKQFYITTHSNIFLNNSLVDMIYWVYFEDSVKIEEAKKRVAIFNDLGYSVTDNMVSDLVILVEGPKDKPVIEEFLFKFDLYNKNDIKIWPLGGDIMNQLDLSVFSEKYKIFALIDNDPLSKKIRDRFMENCKKYHIPVRRLERYSIENYFSVDALKKIFRNQLPENFNRIDPYRKLYDQIGINVKNKTRAIVREMELSDIEDTDLYEFFQEVRKKCEE